MTKEVNIEVPVLARVEGEGALYLKVKNNKIEQLQLKIYEPPRLFEKFLEGREPNEVIDAVARICGICPVGYQMSAVHAIESIFNVKPDIWVRDMRRLFYCGEWMESHTMHIHFLAAPDFMGYPSAMTMAKDHPHIVKRGIHLHNLGNSLMSLLGKRSVNPVGACIGGFYSAPNINDVKNLLSQFQQSLSEAEELIKWTANLPLPETKQNFMCVSIQHPQEYPMNEGEITIDNKLTIKIDEFENHFQEQQVPYSNAFHCYYNDKSYLVGPLARLNLNYDRLPEEIKQIINNTGISFPSKNMFHSIVARAIEIYYAMFEAIRILKNYSIPPSPTIEFTPKAGVGYGCTEAPRGLLWHRYEFNDEGLVKSSRIVPPTSQNQARIEEDLYLSLEQYGLNHSEGELRTHAEMTIRNYDPCISCSTHFLKLKVER